ncbi:MAG: 3,4-dihydroxy-2-butanone-4-phosphate synthase [Chromatiales bacterium]|nr:3,4-dihydroxy-2-butanone-4-phosphate synthase [Chromatiales bacterium]
MTISTIPEIIEQYRNDRMVIIVDDEGRENEGDLMIAAERVTAEHINFMAKYGRGLICLTLTPERCRYLQLPLMVTETNRKLATNFTVSIDAKEGISTGISASDRARTIRVAVADDSRASDLERPGHIFPLMAQPNGVLTRAGHTESGCDIARLAGFEPASVIVEVLKDDGSMARLPDLEEFADRHQLKIGIVGDLVKYRLKND